MFHSNDRPLFIAVQKLGSSLKLVRMQIWAYVREHVHV